MSFQSLRAGFLVHSRGRSVTLSAEKRFDTD